MGQYENIRRIIVILFLLFPFPAPAGGGEPTRTASSETAVPGAEEGSCLPPKVTETFEYYEITGECEADLRRQMKQKGVLWRDGRRYDALTDWELKWDYGYIRSQGSCSVDSFSVDVDIVYRYPTWTAGENAPVDLVFKWGDYFQKLVDHEALHRYQVVEAAAELSRAVSQLPPAATCAELDYAIQCLCNEKIRLLHEDQERYDAVSGHGAAQGAVFP